MGDNVVLGISVVRGTPPTSCARVALVGALCSYSSPLLGDLIDELIDDGVTHIDVRVPRLRLCTAAGLTVLMAAHERLSECGGELVVWEAQGVVRRVLETTGVSETVCAPDHHHSGISPGERSSGSSGRSRRRQPVA